MNVSFSFGWKVTKSFGLLTELLSIPHPDHLKWLKNGVSNSVKFWVSQFRMRVFSGNALFTVTWQCPLFLYGKSGPFENDLPSNTQVSWVSLWLLYDAWKPPEISHFSLINEETLYRTVSISGGFSITSHLGAQM